MYSTYEIAKAMKLVAQGVKQAPGEAALRSLDTLAWAEDHLTEYEKLMVGRLAATL